MRTTIHDYRQVHRVPTVRDVAEALCENGCAILSSERGMSPIIVDYREMHLHKM